MFLFVFSFSVNILKKLNIAHHAACEDSSRDFKMHLKY